LYNDVIVDTFFTAPGALAADVVGAYDSVGTVDQILYAGDDTASLLLAKGGIFSGLSFTIAGFVVYALVDFTALYTMFLLSLSRVALSVLLALGPLFIGLLFFDTTRRFVEAWFAQLANYAFAAVLTVLVASLMLTVLSTAAQQAVAAGGAITSALALRGGLAAGLTLLVMRQVMPMASGLASGIALSSFGAVSGALTRGPRALTEFGRGIVDPQTTRWDSFNRKAGFYSRKATFGLVRAPYAIPRAITRAVRRNSLRASQ
jgi:type IV secretion system protein VirB6